MGHPALAAGLAVVLACAARTGWRWFSTGPPYDSVL
jgi:hypothetical protein